MDSREPDELSGLTAEERRIYARVSRRGFMGATAAATLAALAGREARLRASGRHSLPRRSQGQPADAVIVLWMAGGMAQTETFDPKRYTPFEPGVNIKDVLEHVPGDRHRRRQHQVHAGPGADRQRDGPRHADPLVQRGRPRLHPALAASVSLAHGLRPAAAVACRTSARSISRTLGPKNPACRPSSPSARRSRARARSARSRRSTRRAFSAPSTGRS